MNTMQRAAGIQNPNMKFFRLVLTLLVLILFSAITNSTLLDYSRLSSFTRADASAEQSAFDKREAAYRANNLGVAFLEQYKAKEAVASFTQALEIKPDLLIARINLSIALYYLPEIDRAKREAEKALAQGRNAPQPHYILGLIARAQNRECSAAAGRSDPEQIGRAHV